MKLIKQLVSLQRFSHVFICILLSSPNDLRVITHTRGVTQITSVFKPHLMYVG